MKTEKIVSKKLKSRLSQKQNTAQKRPAVFAPNVTVPNQINYNFVAIDDKVIPVYNDRVPARAGMKIWVGYDAIDNKKGKPKRYQVLSSRSEDPASGQAAVLGFAPAKRYEWNADGGGQDPLHVHQRAISFLKIGVSSLDGNINLYKGKIWTGTAFMNIARQDIDITAQIPTTSGKAAFVMITIDTTGAVIQTKGAEVDIADLGESDRPTVPAGTAFVSGCVRVYYGQVKPLEGRVNTDFDDLRFCWYP